MNHPIDFLPNELYGFAHTASQLFQGNIGFLIQGFQVNLKPAHLAQRANAAAQKQNATCQGSPANIQGDG